MLYDYEQEVEEDIKNYLIRNFSEIRGYDSEEQFIETVVEYLLAEDSITGCRWGYDFSQSNQRGYNSQEAVLENLPLLKKIVDEYEYDYSALYERLFEDGDWDYLDTIIREYFVSSATQDIVYALLQSNDIEFITDDLDEEEEDYDEGFDEEPEF